MFLCKHNTGAKNEGNNSRKSGKNNAYQYSTNGIVVIIIRALIYLRLMIEIDGDITSAEIIKCEDSRKLDYAKHPTAEQIGIFSGRVAEEVDSNLKKTTFTTVECIHRIFSGLERKSWICGIKKMEQTVAPIKYK